MSLWCTEKYIITIGSLDPMITYFGNHKGFDTLEEAAAFMVEFNADTNRLEDRDICGKPELNPKYGTGGSRVEYLP